LENTIKPYLKWGKDHNVPLFVGEFGLYYKCFEDNRGGLNWVADMLSILKENQISFTYHDYHEVGFGLYRTPGNLSPDPTTLNQGLADLFRQSLPEQ
jgi:hypothetical protein